MGALNAIFAPFIVVYLLMYSFFRYFEVSLIICAVRHRTQFGILGIPQQPFEHRRSVVHAVRPVEVPRVQRASASLQAPSERVVRNFKYLHRPVSQRQSHNLGQVRLLTTEWGIGSDMPLGSWRSSQGRLPPSSCSHLSSTQSFFYTSRSRHTAQCCSTSLSSVRSSRRRGA